MFILSLENIDNEPNFLSFLRFFGFPEIATIRVGTSPSNSISTKGLSVGKRNADCPST